MKSTSIMTKTKYGKEWKKIVGNGYRITVGDSKEEEMVTIMQSCLKGDCVENRNSKCALKIMSIGRFGKCTWYIKRNETSKKPPIRDTVKKGK